MSLIRDKTQGQAVIEAVLANLRDKASQLGMVLAGWNAAGTLVESPEPPHEFCRAVCASSNTCAAGRYDLARYVLQQAQPSRATGSLGCCLLGIPIFDHRRLAGAVVLSFPTREMLDEEHLARLCDRLHLDRQVITAYAKQACRYAAAEAGDLQQIFTMLLEDRQETQNANQALTSLSTNLASTYEELSLLYRISGSMKVSQKPARFLQDVCDQLRDVINTDIVAAVVYDVRTRLEEDIVVQAGCETVDSQQIRLLAATHLAPYLADEDSVIIDNDFHGGHDLGFSRHVQNLIAVPLVIDRQNIGLLTALNKQNGDFDSFDAKLIGSIANQASVFLANHRMFAELQDLLMGVLHSLTESIDAKDPYTCGHSRRVAEISRRLAAECSLPAERVQHIYLSGLLHDVGKIGVPEMILCKDGRLTDEEYELVKRHPAIGAKILRRIKNLEPIIAGVLTHHERMDGRGYPDGLKGRDIPMEGRIIGLADSWDAMTSHRTYRRAMSLERAIQEIKDCAGTQFDPRLVKIVLSWKLDDYMKQLNALNANDLHLLDERVC